MQLPVSMESGIIFRKKNKGDSNSYPLSSPAERRLLKKLRVTSFFFFFRENGSSMNMRKMYYGERRRITKRRKQRPELMLLGVIELGDVCVFEKLEVGK